MSKSRRKSHSKKHKTVRLGKKLFNCLKSCKLNKTSKKRKECVRKKCKAVFNKVVKMHNKTKKRKSAKSAKSIKSAKSAKSAKSGKKHHMRGGYGKGTNTFLGIPWHATGAANYYELSKYGVCPGGPEPYPGNISPSPQHGGSGGLYQQLVLNPYRGITGGLANLQNVYAGKALTPSPFPQVQDKVTPQSYFISDINTT